jgi:Tat protein secretion system quality control protein TatD with DNase activity
MTTEEFAITPEDTLVIEWDGETRTLRTYTRGSSEPLYVGDSLDSAAESLEIDRDTLDERLMADPVNIT